MRHLLATVLLAACAEPASLYPEPALAGPHVLHAARTRWLAPTELGYAQQQAWGMPLPAGYGVAILPRAIFLANCEAVTDGCTHATVGFVELAEDRILMRSDLEGDFFNAVLLHEMGHILRGYGGHLGEDACADGVVMCAWNTGAQYPTPEDYDFVLGL